MSTPSSTNAVSPAGSVSPDLADVSGASSAAFSSVGNDLIAELTDQNSREGLNLSTRHDPSTPSTAERHIPATHPDDEDAISSVSQTTAVPRTLRSDVGTRVQTRACEIEEELSRYCVETANRIPVNARHFIMARVFELVKLCSDLRADAAVERGAVTALQGQLLETRREVADLHRRAVLAETRTTTAVLSEVAILPEAVQTSQARPGFPAGPPGALLSSSVPPTAAMTYAAALQAGAAATAVPTRPSAIVPDRGPTLHEHVAFVTPIAPSAAPARDSLRLLKANIDPAAHDIRDVTLRQTRYGLTVLAHSRDTLTNMRQAIADNAITCAALSMRIPEKRNPHVRFSGVDPDITSEEFISRVAERNTHLQLDADKCKVRASFKERSGTSAFIVEVDPDAFARIMRQPRLSCSARVCKDSEAIPRLTQRDVSDVVGGRVYVGLEQPQGVPGRRRSRGDGRHKGDVLVENRARSRREAGRPGRRCGRGGARLECRRVRHGRRRGCGGRQEPDVLSHRKTGLRLRRGPGSRREGGIRQCRGRGPRLRQNGSSMELGHLAARLRGAPAVPSQRLSPRRRQPEGPSIV
ncbi:hypothetical protein HPB52_019459 [Rhipicephalus sanguineus]|uniref:Uncharacterized protein n=1 Tax=Rhipicephalus sanguineus TaxID=34632 RepID=A0A9D4T1G2_RHISA|nr:hypothetical protein HPB52_019459 [Rhipicephalus sanguineus]